ncbi:MAG: hypothetical protein CVU43_17000 [Chloroflexi bacterium HGW-Chloroflexi-5]|jgi:hypothetical protein|nr:MAG: hypothetical protein CVU43_17000 [Chloroflexi bacterium HGW-Chloroflexi-5]
MGNTDKEIIASATVTPTFVRGTGKNIAGAANTAASVLHGVGKHLTKTVTAAASNKKGTGKNITASVTVSGAIYKNAVTITLDYYGNAEVGLGSQEGAQFDIIVTGTFTTFTIAMNGKSLTYTENCVAQTITIDNVNATVKNGTTNKLSKVTGDTADFLKLLPGNNVITITKVGGNVNFLFDFIAQFI